MLSAESAELVRRTLPVVGAALDEITARFYDTMFAEHPDLLDGMFNRGNQANGEQRRALAGSIAGFARALLDHPDERPDALLSRIAHKHVAVGVTDDQYVIVHKYLFGAMTEVLGDALTPDVAAAWDEVYWLMAGALIAAEARLRAVAGIQDGDDVWRTWTVVERRQETPDAVSFLLRPTAGPAPLPPARPGQYVSVRVRMPDGLHQLRQYTLSGGTGGDTRRITVKRVREPGAPEGEVSTLLHDTVDVGAELTLSAPFGDVVPGPGDTPLLLVSAGIGITPMAAVLHDLVDSGSQRPVLALHADRSPRTHALGEEVAGLIDRLPRARGVVWYEDPGDSDARPGRMDLTGLDIPADTEVLMCGPLPFMRAVRADLLAAGISPRSIHYEVFGPDLWLPQDA
ncbi:globin domain-containing protein [Marinactinospora thermotolerans]|uniref:nitric oxide dioxygenase n=1 Tax=Marinactinospora thermotolerans DSM 45154 TaxID=1122192 RepID=A0A1T4SYL1_9ACTN|nr:globin domain-containing protein [Marinactinospora thermotolerans]SKA33344.1 nitric oxide dioxygenase [Marinactinospora thermotolerans DSM 45154]